MCVNEVPRVVTYIDTESAWWLLEAEELDLMGRVLVLQDRVCRGMVARVVRGCARVACALCH